MVKDDIDHDDNIYNFGENNKCNIDKNDNNHNENKNNIAPVPLHTCSSFAIFMASDLKKPKKLIKNQWKTMKEFERKKWEEQTRKRRKRKEKEAKSRNKIRDKESLVLSFIFHF